MQVPTCGCQWSVDVSVSIHPNDTEIWVDPGMAKRCYQSPNFKGKEVCVNIRFAVISMFIISFTILLPDFPLSQSG